MAKARPDAGSSRSSRYYKRVRHLAVTVGFATLVAVTASLSAFPSANSRLSTPAALPLRHAWTIEQTGTPPVALAASAGGWLVAGFDDSLRVFATDTGDVLGTLPLPASQLACDAANCVVGNNQAVRSINLSRRVVRWQRQVPTSLAFAPVLRSGWVFLASTDGRVVALRDVDGAEVWSASAGASLTGPPSVDGDRLVVATTDNRVVMLDVLTGRVLWTYATDARPLIPRLGGGLVLIGTTARDLWWIDALTGRPKFAQRTGGTVIGAPALDDELVYAVSQDGVLRAFDRGNGAQRWYANLPTRPEAGPLTDGAMILVSLHDGRIFGYLPSNAGQRSAVQVSPQGEGDGAKRLPVAPLIAGAGAQLTLLSVVTNVADTSKWWASLTRGGAAVPLSAMPSQIPGLRLTLTAPR